MKRNESRRNSWYVPAELNTKLEDLKKELFHLRFQHATNQLNNPSGLLT